MFIVFWKVVNELNIAFPFVILMSQNHIQRNKLRHGIWSNPISQYWKQILTTFDDVLLEETAHVQLGDHTRKSRKAWKNSVPWKKCQGMSFALAVSSFLNFSLY